MKALHHVRTDTSNRANRWGSLLVRPVAKIVHLEVHLNGVVNVFVQRFTIVWHKCPIVERVKFFEFDRIRCIPRIVVNKPARYVRVQTVGNLVK